jgi:hypothetical protein
MLEMAPPAGAATHGRNALASSTTRRAFVLGAAAAPLLARKAVAQAGFPSRALRIVTVFRPAAGSIIRHG